MSNPKEVLSCEYFDKKQLNLATLYPHQKNKVLGCLLPPWLFKLVEQKTLCQERWITAILLALPQPLLNYKNKNNFLSTIYLLNVKNI